MKFSPKRNLTTKCNRPLILVEIGVGLFFGDSIQKTFIVDEIRGSRPFSEGIDLFQLWKDSNIHPIVLENELNSELQTSKI